MEKDKDDKTDQVPFLEKTVEEEKEDKEGNIFTINDGEFDENYVSQIDQPEMRKTAFIQLAHVHKMTENEKKMMESYESLDYDIVENDLYKQYKRNQTKKTRYLEGFASYGVFLCIGIVTGCVAAVMSMSVEKLSEFRWSLSQKALTEKGKGIAYLEFMGLGVAFVAVASAICAFYEPAAAGSGIPELKAYLNGTNLPNVYSLKALIAKVVGIVFAVSGGLACGKEGPLVHTGAVVAVVLCHVPKLPKLFGMEKLKLFRNDHDKRDFVSGGAAAGVAAAFGAPLGGLLFSLEEASSFWSIPLTWRVFLCSTASTFTLNIVRSAYKGTVDDINNPGLITFGTFVQKPYYLWELGVFVGMAIFGGLYGAFFNSLNHKISKTFNRNLQYYCSSKSAFDELTQCVDFTNFETEEGYRYECQPGYFNPLASLTFQTEELAIHNFFHDQSRYSLLTLFIYCILYFILTLLTYGIAVASGLFVPIILIGCSFGRFVGELLRMAGHDIFPGTYALMGATAMLGGVTRMTISMTVIILETTNNIQYLLPIMITLNIAKWVGDFFNIAIYDTHVELKCIPFVEAVPPVEMATLLARDVMTKPVVCFKDKENCKDILETLMKYSHNGFPVINSKNKLIGLILRNHLIILLTEKKNELSSSPRKIRLESFATSLQSKKKRVESLEFNEREIEKFADHEMDLKPFMNPMPFTVQEQAPLTRVFRLYRSMGIRHLTVVDYENNVVGILTRKELRTDFKTDLF